MQTFKNQFSNHKKFRNLYTLLTSKIATKLVTNFNFHSDYIEINSLTVEIKLSSNNPSNISSNYNRSCGNSDLFLNVYILLKVLATLSVLTVLIKRSFSTLK